MIDKSQLKKFIRFIIERHRVYQRRTEGLPKPWTKDEILRSYRFCNMYRELDTVTVWIAEHWRAHMGSAKSNTWFWMLVARLVNHPETLARMTSMARSNEWKVADFIAAFQAQNKAGRKAWGGAYIVSTNGVAMNKAEYIARHVLQPAWERRSVVQPTTGLTLESLCRRLLMLNGVQGFIAGQVIADAKYADINLKYAEDWWSFAISGPGSRRGLKRVCGMPHNTPWKEERWKEVLDRLWVHVNAELEEQLMPAMHAQDLQNCLCEFDKYERVRTGEGRPRSRYPGSE